MAENNHYRIKFFQVKGFTKKKYIDTTADKATHFQLFQNNVNKGEFTDLKSAIEQIAWYEGHNQEIVSFIEKLEYIQNPIACFITTGITFTKLHGMKIEHKFIA